MKQETKNYLYFGFNIILLILGIFSIFYFNIFTRNHIYWDWIACILTAILLWIVFWILPQMLNIQGFERKTTKKAKESRTSNGDTE